MNKIDHLAMSSLVEISGFGSLQAVPSTLRLFPEVLRSMFRSHLSLKVCGSLKVFGW